jgi:hypothetical protein
LHENGLPPIEATVNFAKRLARNKEQLNGVNLSSNMLIF